MIKYVVQSGRIHGIIGRLWGKRKQIWDDYPSGFSDMIPYGWENCQYTKPKIHESLLQK